jgi:hypothetical protein
VGRQLGVVLALPAASARVLASPKLIGAVLDIAEDTGRMVTVSETVQPRPM